MGIIMGLLDSIGGFMQKLPGFKHLLEIEDDDEDIEKEVLKQMVEKYRQRHPKKTPKKEKKQEPEPEPVKRKKPTSVPRLATTYQVYLIMPENATTHTVLKRFVVKDKEGSEPFYWLAYNKKIYSEDEIEGLRQSYSWEVGEDGNLFKTSSNFMFLDSFGKLTLGKAEFSERAKNVIKNIERTKLKDASVIDTTLHVRNKYQIDNKIQLLLQMILICIGIGLLAWFFFPGLSNVLNTMTSNAQTGWITKHTPIQIDMNNTAIIYYQNISEDGRG